MEMLDWFEWNGVRCTEYGMHALSQPSIISPAERLSSQTVPGRAGALTILEGENIYDGMTLSCSCVIDDPYQTVEDEKASRIAKITGWLRGYGNVKFANRQEGFYRARVANQIQFDKIVQGNPHMSFQVQFNCEPFFYLDSGTTPLRLIQTSRMENPGNIAALPTMKISGRGEGTVMCGGSTMLIDDLTSIGYIILDCEAKIAYKGARDNPSDPLKLLGTRVTGDWLTIPAGDSFFTLQGGITEVELTPRWRCV